jgi:ATP-dependent RNA helicase HelY
LGQIDLPDPYRPNSKAFVREVARGLKDISLAPAEAELPLGETPAEVHRAEVHRAEVHGALGCPDLERHLAAHRQAERLTVRAEGIRTRIDAETDTFARQLERVLGLLERWGYVDGWSLTPAGDLLARIYHECDLLVAESVRSGMLDGLDPATTAGLASVFTFERRGPEEGGPPWFPSVEAEERAGHVAALAHELNVAEKEAGLPLTRPPDPDFFAAAHGWASGGSLDDLLEAEELTGGDFVRNFRQLIDLLRQIADRATEPITREAARQAIAAIDRGVVADAARLQ